MSRKRGMFFSIDALIALAIILIVLLIAYPLVSNNRPKTELHYDLLSTLSTIKISELNNSYAKSLLSDGSIKDPSKSVLEQIGEFYVTNTTKAKLLAESTMGDIGNNNNLGLWFGTTLIASRNATPYESSTEVDSARQIISGIQEGKNITGYSARAYLASSLQTDYFYFGGYIGDGNITARVEYNGTISSAILEIAINADFNLYVNGIFSGNYTKPVSDLTPKKYILPTANFHSGVNTIELKTRSSANLRITGGLIKVDYDKIPEYDKPQRQYIPGINGLVNIYSGFNIPSTLDGMTMNLHFKSPYKMFVKIGGISVFENSSSTETTLTLSNSELSSKLDYNKLSNTTTPMRIGIYAATRNGNADVVVITDLSDSMNNRFDSENTGVTRVCNDSNLYNKDTKKISVAKCLDKAVIDTLLEVPGNRVAVVGFYGDDGTPYKGRVVNTALSSNATLLRGSVDAYIPSGGTCICCGINTAYKTLSEQSLPWRRKYVIVMSDGIPTHTCQAASGCTGTRTGLPSDEGLWLGSSSGCYGGTDDCNANDCNCAVTNTNWSSCRLHNDLNGTVYSIGFGNISSCSLANFTLQSVAICGEGKYYTSNNATILQDFYTNISQEIIDLSYIEQIANTTGNFSNTIIYPDSYIEFDYAKEIQPFGLVATTENLFYNDSTGYFNIPANSSIVKATAISYSGPKWTALINVNNHLIYNLSTYGDEFVLLGDPYAIRIPNSVIEANNTVELFRGTTSYDITTGSPNNKIIYTIVKNASSYTKICARAEGCSWNIQFDDGTNATIRMPSSYAGTETCEYSSTSQQYNENDAFQSAVYNLLRKLDLDLDGNIDIKFNEQSLAISSSQLQGLPFLWSTEVEVRTWA